MIAIALSLFIFAYTYSDGSCMTVTGTTIGGQRCLTEPPVFACPDPNSCMALEYGPFELGAQYPSCEPQAPPDPGPFTQ